MYTGRVLSSIEETTKKTTLTLILYKYDVFGNRPLDGSNSTLIIDQLNVRRLLNEKGYVYLIQEVRNEIPIQHAVILLDPLIKLSITALTCLNLKTPHFSLSTC